MDITTLLNNGAKRDYLEVLTFMLKRCKRLRDALNRRLLKGVDQTRPVLACGGGLNDSQSTQTEIYPEPHAISLIRPTETRLVMRIRDIYSSRD